MFFLTTACEVGFFLEHEKWSNYVLGGYTLAVVKLNPKPPLQATSELKFEFWAPSKFLSKRPMERYKDRELRLPIVDVQVP